MSQQKKQIFTLTKEGVLVSVDNKEYLKGILVFKSNLSGEVGLMPVKEYRKLQNESLDNIVPYALQGANLIKILVLVASRVFFLTPILSFWLFEAALFGGDSTISDLLTHPGLFAYVLRVSLAMSLVACIAAALIKPRLFGYVNCFETHFQECLVKKLPGLREEQYKLGWMPPQIA